MALPPRGNPRSLQAAKGRAAPSAELPWRAAGPPGNAPRRWKTARASPEEPARVRDGRKGPEPRSMTENLAQRRPSPRCAPRGGQQSGYKGQLPPSRQAAAGGRMKDSPRSFSEGLRVPGEGCSGRAAAPAPGASSFEGGRPERRNTTAPGRVIPWKNSGMKRSGAEKQAGLARPGAQHPRRHRPQRPVPWMLPGVQTPSLEAQGWGLPPRCLPRAGRSAQPFPSRAAEAESVFPTLGRSPAQDGAGFGQSWPCRCPAR